MHSFRSIAFVDVQPRLCLYMDQDVGEAPQHIRAIDLVQNMNLHVVVFIERGEYEPYRHRADADRRSACLPPGTDRIPRGTNWSLTLAGSGGDGFWLPIGPLVAFDVDAN